MSATTASSAGETELAPTLMPDGPIIVATDGAPGADASFPIAASLAQRSHAETMVLTVVEPASIPIYGVDGMVISMISEESIGDARASAARAQLHRMAPTAGDWPIVVKEGNPARTIAETATATGARLIIVGRGKHHGLDRIVGGESVLRILQLGDTPVLAVQPGLTSPPRRVVIATDFSPFSLYAAQVAMTIIAPDATVWLLHVGPPLDETVPYLHEHASTYRKMAAAGFAQMRGVLSGDHVRFEDVLLTGTASDEMIKFIGEQRADLVVSATHGYGFLRRMILGSVSAMLVRTAPCSVLAVPGSAQAIATTRARGVPNARTQHFPADTLDKEVAAFSQRNVGRRCKVEIDSDDLGAQVLAHDLQLAGVSYDRHGMNATLMFGTSAGAGAHLSHSIPGVTGIDVSSNAGGVDQVLRISHAGGQTLLSMN